MSGSEALKISIEWGVSKKDRNEGEIFGEGSYAMGDVGGFEEDLGCSRKGGASFFDLLGLRAMDGCHSSLSQRVEVGLYNGTRENMAGAVFQRGDGRVTLRVSASLEQVPVTKVLASHGAVVDFVVERQVIAKDKVVEAALDVWGKASIHDMGVVQRIVALGIQ